MAKKKKRSRGRSPRGSIGGNRWGINFQHAAMGAAAEWVGTQIAKMLPEGTPDFIKTAPITAVGLYGLGVLLRDRSFRSIGAGLAVGKAFIT